MYKRGENPAQDAAKEALKVAKELSSLLNTLAGLQYRKEIAQAAGLTELQDAIERLYALADKYRTGGVQPVGVPAVPGTPQPPSDVDSAGAGIGDAPAPAQQPMPAAEAYIGWDPEKLRRMGKPFVDDTKSPIEVVPDDAEVHRFEKEKTSSPHGVDAPLGEAG